MEQQKYDNYEAWLADGAARFGNDTMKWKFECPVCGHVASVEDWQKSGAPEGAIAYSCIGRYLGNGIHGLPTRKNLDEEKGRGLKIDRTKKPWGPCNYTGGGLFSLNPVSVVDQEGNTHRVFAFAPPL